MAELEVLDETDASNDDELNLGWPENMARANVNNRARELLGALRRHLTNPEFFNTFLEQGGPTLVISKLTDTSFRLVATPDSDLTSRFTVGQRLRIGNASVSIEAYVVSSSYSSPNTDVVVRSETEGTSETITGSSANGTAALPITSYQLLNALAIAGTIRITDTSVHTGGGILYDDGAGILKHGVDGNVGTVNYALGQVTINALAVAFDANAVIDYAHGNVVPNETTGGFIKHHFARTARETGFHQTVVPSDTFAQNMGRGVLWEHLGGAALKEVGPGNGLDADTVDGKHAAALADDAVAAGHNFVVNPSFQVNQRGMINAGHVDVAEYLFSAVDDTYCLDQWIYLVDAGSDVVHPQKLATGGPAGVALTAIRLEASAGASAGPVSEKFGIFQPIEGRVAVAMAGETVSFSFYARATGLLSPISVAILEWTSPGVIDVITSDPITTWNAAGADPTLATNWSVVGTTWSDFNLDGTWTRYKVEGKAVASGALNLGLLLIADDTGYNIGDEIELSACKLEIGALATRYVDPPIARTYIDCYRYCWSSFDPTLAVKSNLARGQGEINSVLSGLDDPGGPVSGATVRIPVEMFAAPTILSARPGAAGTTWRTGSTPTFPFIGTRVVTVGAAGGSGDGIQLVLQANL